MEFWNSILTEKSHEILIDIAKKSFKFVLIGGWAIYFWTKMHKSKDIDIIVDFESLKYLKDNYNLVKNERLKKYEIKMAEIDIDVYVPFYSELGIPIGEIQKHTTIIENITVVKPEILLILKQIAEKAREESIKAQKDRIDIMSLALSGIDWHEYHKLLVGYELGEFHDRLIRIIKNFKDIKYLEIDPRQFKIKKEKLLKELKDG